MDIASVRLASGVNGVTCKADAHHNLRANLLALLLCASVAIGITFSRHASYLHVPEEASMLDYSVALNCLDFSDKAFWSSFSCPEQISLIIPWGLVSSASKLFGLGIAAEYRLIFFLRVFLLLVAFYKLFHALTAHRAISLVCTVLPLGIPYVIEAMYYGHQWGNLGLSIGSMWVFTQTFENQKLMRWSALIVLFSTLSVFQNLAHLVSAWLAVLVAVAACRIMSDSEIALRRTRAFLSLALTLYFVPTIVYLFRIRFWSPLELHELRVLGNGGFLQVLQGFGSWWQDAFFSSSKGEQLPYRDLTLFTSRTRQGIRIVIFVVAISAPVVFTRSSIISEHFKRQKAIARLLLVALVFSLMLSGVGGTRYFFIVWSWLPEPLKLFREPWQKFVPLYLVFLYSLLAISLARAVRIMKNVATRSVFVAALVPIVGFLIYPAFTTFDIKHPDQIAINSLPVKYWSQLNDDLQETRFSLAVGRSCITSVDQTNPAYALVELRLWDYLSDTPRLRTLSINDALRELDVKWDHCVGRNGDFLQLEFKSDLVKTDDVCQVQTTLGEGNRKILELETLRLIPLVSRDCPFQKGKTTSHINAIVYASAK